MFEGSRQRQYLGLDLIRFAAAAAVMIFHLTYLAWLHPANPAEADFRAAFDGFDALTRWGWSGVHVFFVLSGFVIAFSAHGRSAADFAVARTSRLYPAAWVCAILTFVIVGGTGGELLRSMSLWPVGPWVDGVYWTLGIEILFYLLVMMALHFGAPIAALGIAIGLVSTAYWLLKVLDFVTGRHFAPMFDVMDSMWILSLLRFGCFFAVGILLWSHCCVRRSSANRILLSIFLVAGVICLAASGRFRIADEGGPAWQAVIPPIGWLFSVFLIWTSVHWAEGLHALLQDRAATVRMIGLITYPLYLLHNEVGRLFMRNLASAGPAVALIVTIISILLLCRFAVWCEPRIRSAVRKTFAERRREPVTEHIARRNFEKRSSSPTSAGTLNNC